MKLNTSRRPKMIFDRQLNIDANSILKNCE